MGGGRLNFLPEGNGGRRKDGLNLINEWKADHTAKGDKPEYLENKQDMLAIKNDTTHILGLFNGDHLDYHLLANKDDQPTLEEMTETAIKVLSKNKNGFFLFVEGLK